MTMTAAELSGRFFADPSGILFKPRYNLAPGQEATVITSANQERAIKMMKWGLIPRWAKDSSIAYKTINARAETVATKPAFRDALKRRRCLIPADGFYEWKKNPVGGAKIPYRVILKGGAPFAFAGLWEAWSGEKEGEITSFTIITTAANPLIAQIHDRMPVILKREDEEEWINDHNHTPLNLLTGHSPDEMDFFEVSRLVNSAANDRPECLRPVFTIPVGRRSSQKNCRGE